MHGALLFLFREIAAAGEHLLPGGAFLLGFPILVSWAGFPV